MQVQKWSFSTLSGLFKYLFVSHLLGRCFVILYPLAGGTYDCGAVLQMFSKWQCDAICFPYYSHPARRHAWNGTIKGFSILK